MALSTMYPAQPNSPQTTLAADITAADTSMTVLDATVLPAAPNLCTIGDDENAEVVSYTTITGNVVSGLVRGQSGTVASVWTTGTPVARDFTSYDHDTFIGNINDLDTNKAPLASPTFTGTPEITTTPTNTDNSNKIADTAYVNSHDDFKITGTVSSGGYTLTDARIDNSHWEVDWIYFETPSNVTTRVHWVTDTTNHQVSLGATYTGSTNVVVNMHWVQ